MDEETAYLRTRYQELILFRWGYKRLKSSIARGMQQLSEKIPPPCSSSPRWSKLMLRKPPESP